MMLAKVSIITPVYTAAKCIERYICSILAQTYTNLEVLIIDDHGEDGAIDTARKLTDSYTGPISFKFFSTEYNSGPGTARNMGIDAAEGKYLAFVDCDDVIDPRFCEIMVRSAEHNNSDLCCCNLELTDSDGNVIGERRHPKIGNGEFSGKRRRQFLTHYVTYFWTFLFRRDMIVDNNIRFPSTKYSEDSVMLCCSLLRCKRFSQVDECLYKYVKTEGSLTATVDNTRYLQKLSSFKTLMEIVRERGWYYPEKELIDFIYIKKGYLVSAFDYAATTETPNSDVLNDIRNEIMAVLPDYRKCPYFRTDIRLQLFEMLIRKAPAPTVALIKLYTRNGVLFQ